MAWICQKLVWILLLLFSSTAARPPVEECFCSCPIRAKLPLLPTALSLLAKDANVSALQNWMLDRYQFRTFNTCECQKRPLRVTRRWNSKLTMRKRRSQSTNPFRSIYMSNRKWRPQSTEMSNSVSCRLVQWANRLAGAIEWSRHGRNTATRDAQWTCRCSTNMLSVKQHTQTSFSPATLVPSGTKKTISHAWNRYHTVSTRWDDHHLATYITSWGRY